MHVHLSDPSWDSRLLSFFSNLSGEDDVLPAILATWPDKQAAEEVASWYHPLAKDPVYRYHDHAFEETFCFLMNVLDTMFMDAGATYMDFPIIFQRCETQLMQWLAATPRPTSIQQLYHFFLDGEASQTNKARHAVAVMPVHVATPFLHRLVDQSQDPPWLSHYRASPTYATTSAGHLGAKSGPSSPQNQMDGGPDAPKVVDIDDYRSLPSSVQSIDRPITATKTRKEVALELINDTPSSLGPDQRSPQKGGAWSSPFHRGYPLAQLYQRRTSSQQHERQDSDSLLSKRPTSADQVTDPPRLTLHLSEVERDVLLPDFDHFTFQEESGHHAFTAPTSPIAKGDVSFSNKQLSLDRKPKGPRPLTANRGRPS